MEERAGERRDVFLGDSPLPDPLPTRASRGEGEDSRSPGTLFRWQWGRGYLVDTNVLSEPTRPRPNARVLAWLETHESELYASAFTIAEMAFGIAALVSGRKKQNLQRQLRQLLTSMEGRVLPFNKRVALEWGDMQAELQRSGQLMPLEDSLIAATARRYGLDVATRNVEDFKRARLRVVNPWETATTPQSPPAAA